jgi:hypothetical protein
MKRNRVRFVALLLCLLTFPLFAAKPSRAQGAQNGPRDLSGANMGDFIALTWAHERTSTTYVMYRSSSQTGPWQEIGRIESDVSRTSGAKVDYTPDARLMTLCYKVEALDSSGAVIRSYQPACIPAFAG